MIDLKRITFPKKQDHSKVNKKFIKKQKRVMAFIDEFFEDEFMKKVSKELSREELSDNTNDQKPYACWLTEEGFIYYMGKVKIRDFKLKKE